MIVTIQDSSRGSLSVKASTDDETVRAILLLRLLSNNNSKIKIKKDERKKQCTVANGRYN